MLVRRYRYQLLVLLLVFVGLSANYHDHPRVASLKIRVFEFGMAISRHKPGG